MNCFEINISLNGKHFFATAERSITSHADLMQKYRVFCEKFPKSEGYEIEVIEYSKQGTLLNMSLQHLRED